MSILSLNCLLVNDDSTQAFTVKIPKTDNISILKELIKGKKAPHLDRLAASNLILWKVKLSIDFGLNLESDPAFVVGHANISVLS
jgi:hypothetical protein